MKVQNKKTGKVAYITPEEWAKLKDMGDQSKFKVLDAKATIKESIYDTEIKPIDLKVTPFDDEIPKVKKVRKTKKTNEDGSN
jgi:hypothetical protein